MECFRIDESGYTGFDLLNVRSNPSIMFPIGVIKIDLKPPENV